jgi:hypothetical protein
VNRTRSPILIRVVRAAAPLVLALSHGRSWAEPLRYDVAIPDGESVAYSAALDVRVAGPIAVRVEGPSLRTITLRLEPPDGPTGTVRRSGPPPLVLSTIADPARNGLGTWRLELRAPAGRGPTILKLSVELSEPVVRRAAPPPTPPIVPAATPPPATPWDYDRRRAAPEEHRAFLAAAEEFAVSQAPGGASPVDACRWQTDFVAYLDKRAAGLSSGRRLPQTTRDVLARIARAVDAVAELKDSSDPLLAGPEPEDRQLTLAWHRARAERLAPLETELDELLSAVQREQDPELIGASWPGRLVTCLTACERYFDDRARVGQSRAANRELTRAQWPRILVAARALRELSNVDPSSTARARP